MGFDRTLSSIQTTMWRWQVLEGGSRTTFAGAHVVQGEGGYGFDRTLTSIQTTMWRWLVFPSQVALGQIGALKIQKELDHAAPRPPAGPCSGLSWAAAGPPEPSRCAVRPVVGGAAAALPTDAAQQRPAFPLLSGAGQSADVPR